MEKINYSLGYGRIYAYIIFWLKKNKIKNKKINMMRGVEVTLECCGIKKKNNGGTRVAREEILVGEKVYL